MIGGSKEMLVNWEKRGGAMGCVAK